MTATTPPPSLSAWETPPEIIAVSGPTPESIQQQLKKIAAWPPSSTPEDALFSLAAESRDTFSPLHARRMCLLLPGPDDWPKTLDEAIQTAAQDPAAGICTKTVFYGKGPAPGKLAFVFPGQGSQYVGMGGDLARAFPEAREALDLANAVCGTERRLLAHIFPCPETSGKTSASAEEALRSTDIAQPAIGAVSLAMTRVLDRFGVKPEATCGHSYGELSALHAAGVYDARTFLALSAARGKYMAAAGDAVEKGGMIAVKAPLAQVEQLVTEANLDLVLANRNSPDQGVLSGPRAAVAAMKSLCREQRLIAAILPVSGAFHSRLVASAAKPFAAEIAASAFFRPRIPVYANTTAMPYPSSPEAVKTLLSGHLTQPVNFIDAILKMHADGVACFLETGPRTVLTGLIAAILKGRPHEALALDGSCGKQPGLMDLAAALCRLGALGYGVRLARWGGKMTNDEFKMTN